MKLNSNLLSWKKSIACALLLLSLTMLFTVSASAAIASTEPDLAVSLVVTATEVAPGEAFAVDVLLDQNVGFYRADMELIYDPAVLTYVGQNADNSVFSTDDLAITPQYTTEGGTIPTGRIRIRIGGHVTPDKLYTDLSSLTPYKKINADKADHVARLTFRMKDNVAEDRAIDLEVKANGKNVIAVAENDLGFTFDGVTTDGDVATLQYKAAATHTHVLNTSTWHDHKDDKATCTEDGILPHYFCVGCQTAFDADKKPMASIVDPATNHKGTTSELIPEVAATCEGAGTKAHYACSACGAVFDADQKLTTAEKLVISATGHTSVVLPAKDPTCTDTGLTEGVGCSNEGCGEVLIAQGVVERVPHRYGDWSIIRPATEAAAGIKTRTCLDCGAKEEDTIPMLAPGSAAPVTANKPLSWWVIALLCVLGALLVGGIGITVATVMTAAKKKQALGESGSNGKRKR